jgi:hypothetical protein
MKPCNFVVLTIAILWALVCAGTVHSNAQSTKALLLFGVHDHKTFLGCLNCVDTSTVSLCNGFGEFGSEFRSNSIWNEFGHFGNEFSGESPWNEFANEAPIIVDKDGNSYGYFSANEQHHDRTRIDWIVAILDVYRETSNLEKTRKAMCGD